jgi:hypothetical protein
MSPKAEQYLAKANECADFASMMSDPNAKRTLEEVAQRWFKMAERVEQDECAEQEKLRGH